MTMHDRGDLSGGATTGTHSITLCSGAMRHSSCGRARLRLLESCLRLAGHDATSAMLWADVMRGCRG